MYFRNSLREREEGRKRFGVALGEGLGGGFPFGEGVD
jgi:hypothetical protein